MTIDASVWVSELVSSDANHGRAHAWLTLNPDISIVVPVLVLAEVAGAIARRSGRSEAAWRGIDLMLERPDFHLVDIDEPLARAAADFAARLHLRGADAIYAAVARYHRQSLVTFDSELATRVQAAVPVIVP